MATNINYLNRGRLAVSGYVIYQYTSDIIDDPSPQNIAKETGVVAIQLGSIWYGELLVMRGIGYGATRIITAPVTWIASAIVVAGGAYSYALFGKKGLDDYVDFIDDVISLDLDDLGEKLQFTGKTILEEAPSIMEDVAFVGSHLGKELLRDFNELPIIQDLFRMQENITAPLKLNIE
ncbi:MAG: hypothetical protein ACXABD_21915 [Candidatus Thorarchaeota archaeon]|jgi:hypothetical protein